MTFTKQSRVGKSPAAARVFLAGMPKAGKSTLAAGWNPEKTGIIDTHNGTSLLDGEHFVQNIANFDQFVTAVDEVVKGGHGLDTFVIDLIDDVYRFADQHAAGKKNLVAAGLIEYGKGLAEAVGLFQREVGRLLESPYGIWFLSHTDTVEEGQITRYIPRLDKRVRTYVEGACDFVFLAETLGPVRKLHTAPTAKFQAGSRVPLPEPMEMDSRALWKAMADGLGYDALKTTTNEKTGVAA